MKEKDSKEKNNSILQGLVVVFTIIVYFTIFLKIMFL